ncbi:MAG: GGDEF domain-containing response regulator [Gemmatimonadetes bacterium]|nr:MAG: GGDEF domain-containing response regulator [Gemmatimonadota bacterium]
MIREPVVDPPTLAPFALPSEGRAIPTLDGALAAALERVTGLASTVLRVPTAFVALLGSDRRCFAGGPAVPRWLAHDPGTLFRSGLSGRILMSEQLTALRDARADPSPGVATTARDFGVAGFLGMRLVSADGEATAIFCAVDVEPRDWTAEETRLFREIAISALTEIELQRRTADAERIEQQLRHDALHDRLTGLPNRAFFVERVRIAVERARRNPDECFGVLFLDLDNFKAINDSFGHVAGDELLLEVSRRLTGCLRSLDMLARLGGDEFALLLENIREPSDAARVAERLQASLQTPITVGEDEAYTSVSLGIAVHSEADDHPQHLLRSADLALYRAKEQGRARFQVFDPRMHEEAVRRLRLETDLRRALERNQFRLHYQPVVSLDTGRIVAVEALLRWEHPERGLVPPGEFIHVAEEAGIISEISRWVLEQACRQCQSWRRDHGDDAPESVWVNLSMRQLAEGGLARQVSEVLQSLRFEAKRLTLEVTENLLVENVDVSLRTLSELHELGVRVFMDDFGSGHSSLGFLDRLAIDGIKIDRSFIGHLGAGDRPLQLVRTIVALVRGLGFIPIAEGVETEEQLRLLRDMGCEFAQGFHFSRAVPPDGIAKLLKVRVRW